jgi:hypothetical protein
MSSKGNIIISLLTSFENRIKMHDSFILFGLSSFRSKHKNLIGFCSETRDLVWSEYMLMDQDWRLP